LDPNEVFFPAMEKFHGEGNVIVAHEAMTGKAIAWWDDGQMMWTRLMWAVNAAVQGKTFDSVTFIWMQGKDDSGNPIPYDGKLHALFDRMQALFPYTKMNYIVGRINDWDTRSTWMRIREIQENICKDKSNFRLINTDDLNGPNDDLHNYGMYDVLAQRYVDAAISMNESKYMPGVMYLLSRSQKIHK
jgi:hypothetical protein